MSKVSINTSTLTAIGDAIREKTGKTNLIAPGTMANEIRGIVSGGGADLPTQAFNITGDCQYRFANDGWNWFIDAFGDQITTSNISGIAYMFMGSQSIKNIPFTINLVNWGIDAQSVFNNCMSLTTLPTITNLQPTGLYQIFYGCKRLREIPDDFINSVDWTFIDNASDEWTADMSFMFADCSSLRTVPYELIKHQNQYHGSGCTYLSGAFYCCHSLDEAVNLPIPAYSNWYDSPFYNTFEQCSRIKDITFETNEDGTPKVMNWSEQCLRLSNYTGWADAAGNITNYNSGITADKEVKDDASYQTLKDNPDWFTCKVEYSRYNHDSAVATINSLPDTSAFLAETGGSNVIEFNGAAGSATDGGAINTLTEEEIAVAAIKGWTVSLV